MSGKDKGMIATIFALVLALVIMIFMLVNGTDQIRRVQAFRSEFIERCHAKHGKIIHLRGSISRACIGPDGRWLESY